MKKYLNTLFVTTQGAYLSKEGESVVVSVEREQRLRVPVISLGSIICFGNVMLSPYLMGFCCENNVSISFLTEHGRFLAKVEGPVSGNVLLRREQYRKADDAASAAKIARAIVIGKIANCRKVLQRAIRDHGAEKASGPLDGIVSRLGQYLDRLKNDLPLEEVRGIEGDSSRSYFSAFDSMITAQKEDFFFRGRTRRPPEDNVNCLLSFVYTILLHDVRAALQGVGLDPQVGFLHSDRPGRPSLALDLMEEFRAPFADRFVLSLINLKQLVKSGFVKSEAGGVILTDEARKTFLTAYQKRKQDVVEHPFIGEKVEVGLLFHVQAMLFARFLRGDLDAYPPFLWK